MFDWENTIALHAMQGNQASSLGEGEVSCVFSSCGRRLGETLEKAIVLQLFWTEGLTSF